MTRLAGKVALITGGASGLGEATAKLFANEGAKVVVADVNDARGAKVAADIKEGGGQATYVRTDVTSSDQVKNAVAAAEKSYGKLDVVIANAGISGSGSGKTLEQISEDEWDQIMNVNLNGVMRTFKYAIPALRRAGGGAMSATASIAGVARVSDTLSAYGASKAGVVSLVRQLAYELADDNVRVNCVCPGGMETNLSESRGLSSQEMEQMRRRRQAQRQARGKLGRTATDLREVASAHLFLVSDDASFVNGQAVVADAGWLLRFPKGLT
ncbi:MAG: glucose 1-dehydrogenase [SAR202 cluster bacterium]|nr:glucose 1-dehydrogenase [SAR202 cluster bacterium]